ncbi:MAG: copper amine oxidase N-terminal domain-containing protein [Syntrophomonas sp.]
MYKKIICLALLLLCVLPFPNNVYAQNEPTVILNGNVLTFDVQPVIVEGRLLVPLSGIFNALGATVSWDAATQTINASQGNTTLMLVIGSQKALINGAEVVFDVPALIMNSRTMVPLGFVAMSLDCQVSYDAVSNTVTINSISNPQAPEPSTRIDLTGTWHSPYSIIWITQIDDRLTATVHDTSKDMASEDWSCTGTVSGNTVTIDFQQNSNSNNTIKGTFDLNNSGNRMEGTMVPSYAASYNFVIERATPGDLTGKWHSQGSTFWIIQKNDILTGRARDNKTNNEWSLDGNVSGNMVTINFDDKASSGIIKGIFELKNDGNLLEGTMTPSWNNSYSFIIQR